MANNDRPSDTTKIGQFAYDDVAGADAAGVLAPAIGKRRTGYAGGEKPTAQELNAILSENFRVNAYLINRAIGKVDHVNLGLGYNIGASTIARSIDPQVWTSTNGSATEINIPLIYPVGNKITRIDVELLEADAGGEEVTLKIQEIDAGSINQLGDTITSGTTNGVVVQTWDDTTNDSVNEIPFTIAAGKQYRINVAFASTSDNDEAQLLDVKVTRD